MKNIEVKARDNEPNQSVLRRFSQRVRSSNLMRVARGQRYYNRKKSKTIRRQNRLSMIERGKEFEFLRKLGRNPGRSRRR